MGRGRAPKGEYAGKTEVMSFRLTPDTKAALRRAAATSGRSLSQEAEHRLRRGHDEEEAISKLGGDVTRPPRASTPASAHRRPMSATSPSGANTSPPWIC